MSTTISSLKRLFIFIIVGLLYQTSYSQDPNFHIYLSFGQSNMEGQGIIEPQDTITNIRFQMMQAIDCPNLNKLEGNWYPAKPPLCQCYSGLSPANSFGKTMIKNLPDSIKIGIINVSVAGSDIRLFDKKLHSNYDSTYKAKWYLDKIANYGGNPYQHLIKLAKLAQQDGVIKGILLHQGETNTGDEEWPWYVKKIYKNTLKDLSLKAKETPLLAGELVHFDQKGKCARMNYIIETLPDAIRTAHVISSKGCSAQGDNVHFNSEGYRELGKRYALKMLSLQGY